MNISKSHRAHDFEGTSTRNPDKLIFHDPKTNYTLKSSNQAITSSLEELIININIKTSMDTGNVH